ncbi:MAG: hypothetical protein KIS61_35690 [Candidatus Eremiobacteraeota bacterium]|nr:hypothetical protein [Candidatus Eremiobacteraeota bacterium]
MLEAVLTGTLFFLLLHLLFSIVVPMMRASQKGSELSDLRQMAALTLETICADVEESGAPGLQLFDNALSVHRVETISADGSTVWNRYVHFYVWGQGRLRRCTFPPVPAGLPAPQQGRPFRLQPGELSAALSAPGSLLCSDLAEFSVEGFSPHGLRPPLVFQLRLRRDQQVFSLEQSAVPAVRNLR